MLVISSWYLVSRIAVACVLQIRPFLACGKKADAGNSATEGESIGIWSTSGVCQHREAVVGITGLPKD